MTARRPVAAKQLTVTFDTDLRSEPLTELPGCLARDFDVTVRYENGTFLRQVRDNCRRQVRFVLELPEDKERGRKAAEGRNPSAAGESGLGAMAEREPGTSWESGRKAAEGRNPSTAGGGIREIEIVILRSWGKEAGIYGVNLW